MVSITILIDGEESVVLQQAEGDSEKFVNGMIDLLERFRVQASEPCAAGFKCKVLVNWIQQIEEVIRNA